MKLRIGDLFSGIGGISLGLERTGGFETAWFSEIEPYCCEVLGEHWPGVPNHGDITRIDWSTVEPVDVLCGGFPCQPASVAGKRKGVDDDRWLWPEFARAIRALRPRFIIAENVPGLLTVSGGAAFAEVLGDLAALGYDAEWAVFPAAAVGAPHKRDRVWIVAYTAQQQQHGSGCARGRRDELADGSGAMADAGCAERRADATGGYDPDGNDTGRTEIDGRVEQRRAPAHTPNPGRREGRAEHAPRQRGSAPAGNGGAALENPAGDPDGTEVECDQAGGPNAERPSSGPRGSGRIFRPIPRSDFWADAVLVRNRPVKPHLGLLAHGVPRRVAKLRALGNAVVPQCAEYVGMCIQEEIARRLEFPTG